MFNKSLKESILKEANDRCKGTLVSTLGIVFTDVGEHFLEAKIKVTPNLHQPAGVLHGGATAALAETVGTVKPFGGASESLLGVETVVADTQNHKTLVQAIDNGGDFQARRTENVSTQHFFVRATNREFNYSNNPTYTADDGTFAESSFEIDPQTYITTVGLLNTSNELIAVANIPI